MTQHATSDSSVSAHSITPVEWDAPDFTEILNDRSLLREPNKIGYRFFRLGAVGEGKMAAYRLAMENVICSLNNPKYMIAYVLVGRPEGVELYFGVASADGKADITVAADAFKAAFEGNFLGAQLQMEKDDVLPLDGYLTKMKRVGLMTGIPSLNSDENQLDDEDFQGVERLINSLMGESWALLLVAEPGEEKALHAEIDNIFELSTKVSAFVSESHQESSNLNETLAKSSGSNTSRSEAESKGTGTNTSKTMGASKGSSSTKGTSNSNCSSQSGTSDSKTEGSSTSDPTSYTATTGDNKSLSIASSEGRSTALTRQVTNKRLEDMQKHLDESLLERMRLGRSKGMFRSAIYLLAENRATYDRLARGAQSIFQGVGSSITPLQARELKLESPKLSQLLRICKVNLGHISSETALVHSTPVDHYYQTAWAATWLNARELALIAGLPTREIPGLKIRPSVDFALNAGDRTNGDKEIHLGRLVQHGRVLAQSCVGISHDELNKHIFICGVTGAGKTTTCMKLLRDSKLNFMVLEPAKTEYRAMCASDPSIEYYALGREDLTPFRLNPFELVCPEESLAGHIDTLKATLAAVFPMEAAMPYIVAEAIIKAYQHKGWDIHSGENDLYDEPFASGSHAWPTFSDMLAQLDTVITSKGMGREFEEKYRGSLVARLTDLTLGTKGRMLNTPHSINFDLLLDKKVVIEMEELRDESDKALFMGLIISRVAETMKHRHRKNKDFKHITLIEEAHRLLTRPEPGEDGARRLGVEMFANLLSEVRKYGECLIIADQIPNKLVADVIKNTNTKIVHRLFAADDRQAIGDAICLNDEQKNFLPMLEPGEVIIYSGGWHAPVRAKITQGAQTDGKDIDEEKIKEAGYQQTWAQKGCLFPLLSAQPAMSSPEILGAFVEAGYSLLAKLNRFLSIQESERSKSKIGKKLQGKYAEQFDRLVVKLVDENAVAECLAAFLFDTYFYDDGKEPLRDGMPQCLRAFKQGIDEICSFIESNRVFKKYFLSIE